MHSISNIYKLAKNLSGDSISLQLVIFVRVLYFIFSRKLFKKIQNKDFIFPGTHNNRKIVYRLKHPMDVASLMEIFVSREYDWDLGYEPDIVIDFGAHFGDTAIYYHSVYPQAKIIAVEAEENNYKRLLDNTKNIKQIIPVKLAIGDRDAMVEFDVSESTLGHSVFNRGGNRTMVEQVALSTFFKKFDLGKVGLIKFDIEGAEFNLFDSIDPKNYSLAYIGEFHEDLKPKEVQMDVSAKFSGYNLQKDTINKNRYILKALHK